MRFPISVKCEDVLNVPRKRVDTIHTFESQEEYNQWLNNVKRWEELAGKKSTYTIISAQPPTMIVSVSV